MNKTAIGLQCIVGSNLPCCLFRLKIAVYSVYNSVIIEDVAKTSLFVNTYEAEAYAENKHILFV